ncbi:MAG TPA: MFS transporter [Frankiaceae bacterium]|jgi:EmrB/QacA subfamily drug resistance transporter|nr:MFS transporter [Frankiaceae bacterium]
MMAGKGRGQPLAPVTQGHPRQWTILAVVLSAMMVVVLDTTILNVALPSMERELSASQSQQEWMVDAYTLTFAGFMFAAGVMGDRFGRKRLMLLGLALFGISSLACAMATSPYFVIASRAVMGIGAAAVVPTTLSVISNVFSDADRPRAIGIYAGLIGASVAAGPIVGGLLLSGFWWGSVFLVNVPLSLVAILLIWRLVPESRDPAGRELQSLPVLQSILGLVLVIFAIIKGGEHGVWFSPGVVAPLLAGLVLLAGFVWRQAVSSAPMLDVSLFRNPVFAVASSATGLTMFALAGATFYLVFYLQFVRGFSPLAAGLALVPAAVAQMVFSPRASALVKRFGTRAVCASGLVVVALAFLGIHLVSESTPIWYLELLLFVQGAGMSHVFAPSTAAVMSTVPREQAGAGSALNNTVRNVGQALGVAILGSLISSIYRAHVTPSLRVLPADARLKAGESIGATRAAIADAAAHGHDIAGLLPAAERAFVHAMHWASLVSAFVALLSAIVVLVFLQPVARTAPSRWRSRRPGSGRSQLEPDDYAELKGTTSPTPAGKSPLT